MSLPGLTPMFIYIQYICTIILFVRNYRRGNGVVGQASKRRNDNNAQRQPERSRDKRLWHDKTKNEAPRCADKVFCCSC